jgi:hypothetical protein
MMATEAVRKVQMKALDCMIEEATYMTIMRKAVCDEDPALVMVAQDHLGKLADEFMHSQAKAMARVILEDMQDRGVELPDANESWKDAEDRLAVRVLEVFPDYNKQKEEITVDLLAALLDRITTPEQEDKA